MYIVVCKNDGYYSCEKRMNYLNLKIKRMRLKTSIDYLKICALLLFSSALTVLQAQNSINTTGKTASDIGGTVSWSVGQIVYKMHSGPDGSVAEGVQHPYEISVVDGIESAIDLQLTVYPNPTFENIEIEAKNYNVQSLRYRLYNMNGLLLKTEKIIGSRAKISMQHYLPATYLLIVFNENRALKTYKIIKH